MWAARNYCTIINNLEGQIFWCTRSFETSPEGKLCGQNAIWVLQLSFMGFCCRYKLGSLIEKCALYSPSFSSTWSTIDEQSSSSMSFTVLLKWNLPLVDVFFVVEKDCFSWHSVLSEANSITGPNSWKALSYLHLSIFLNGKKAFSHPTPLTEGSVKEMSLGSFRTVWRFARVIVAPVITLICRLSSLLEEEQSCQVLRLQDKSERGEKEKATSHVNNLNFCTHRHRKAALEQRYKKRCKKRWPWWTLAISFFSPPFSTSWNRANHSQIYEMLIFCIFMHFLC